MNLFDLHADTGGKIARSVPRAEGCIEGVNYSEVIVVDGPRRLLGFSDSDSAPVKYGAFMPHIAAGVKSFGPAEIPLNDGRAFSLSAYPGDEWTNVSIDLDKFYLA